MNELLDLIWSRLYSGANAGRERSPFTMLQAATLGLDGAPKVRTIVLRRADKHSGTLSFHTDVRSEKVAELRRDGRMAVVGCDLEAGVQLRVEGIASISDDLKERESVWNSSRPRTLVLFQAPLTPGTPITSPSEAHRPTGPVEPGSMAGFENFCLVNVNLSKIEYLDLGSQVHLRARYTRNGQTWSGTWLAP